MSRIRTDPTGGGARRPALPSIAHADAASGPTALQTLLDALPVPAAAICLVEGAPWIDASNAPFARLSRRLDESCYVDDLTTILRAHLGDTAATVARFVWDEPGVGGRHFCIHLARLEPHPRFGPRTLLTLLDRTAEIEAERSLRKEMLHDSLTGLPNRLAFSDQVNDAAGGHFAVIALDLDRFSRVNDSVGSLAGDELIITVARRLVEAIDPPDIVARMAADEFGILVHLREGPGDALHVARRLQAALVTPIRLADLEIRIDCAIGCALAHDGGVVPNDLLRNAQFALKRAKQSGRIEVYQAHEAGVAWHRFSLETELRRAIDGDALDIAFQPLIDLDGQGVVGFEALTRWVHPERGLISPTDFIPVAEESGLIVPLGRWALDRALRTLAEWDAAAGAPLPFHMSVNVSPVQLQRDAVAPLVADALARHGIAGGRLTLELTESTIIADPDRASRVLNDLKALGCRLAMDDFGTGYSNLAYLQRLPIDVLKIDRQFVTRMLGDRDATAIVRAILSLATALGMTTVAEGIETLSIARTLAALGCAIGQGFHFGEPMSAGDAIAFHRARSA